MSNFLGLSTPIKLTCALGSSLCFQILPLTSHSWCFWYHIRLPLTRLVHPSSICSAQGQPPCLTVVSIPWCNLHTRTPPWDQAGAHLPLEITPLFCYFPCPVLPSFSFLPSVNTSSLHYFLENPCLRFHFQEPKLRYSIVSVPVSAVLRRFLSLATQSSEGTSLTSLHYVSFHSKSSLYNNVSYIHYMVISTFNYLPVVEHMGVILFCSIQYCDKVLTFEVQKIKQIRKYLFHLAYLVKAKFKSPLGALCHLLYPPVLK